MIRSSRKKKSKVSALKKFRRRITYSELFLNVAAGLIRFILSVYSKTLRFEKVYNPQSFERFIHDSILTFWHGRQFLLIATFSNTGVVLMTDLSWAGELQTRILSKFGYNIVRGSSKRKGAKALIQTKQLLEKHYSCALAVDGPRGPIYESKPGALFLANKLGIPIIPMATSSKSNWIIKSTWCDYMLPKPFSRCFVVMGEPLWPDETFTTQSLDEIMNRMTKDADEKMGHANLSSNENNVSI